VFFKNPGCYPYCTSLKHEIEQNWAHFKMLRVGLQWTGNFCCSFEAGLGSFLGRGALDLPQVDLYFYLPQAKQEGSLQETKSWV